MMIQPVGDTGDGTAEPTTSYVGLEPMEVDLESGPRNGNQSQGRGGLRYGGDNSEMNYDAIEEDEEYFGVDNLDVFFSSVYEYFHDGGFSSIATKGVVNIITLGFTVFFSTFLIGFVNWGLLLECTGEDTCYEFEYYTRSLGTHPFLFRVFVVLYTTVFFVYWVWTVLAFTGTLKRSWQMRAFFEKRLKISTRELQTMEWHVIVDKLIEIQQHGENPIQINGESFTAKDVAMRIMRKRNYMIAFVNESVLPVGTEFLGRSWFLGMNLELMLEMCILDHMFDSQFRLRRDFLRGEEALKRRFRLFGVLNFLLMPFSLGFMCIYSFLKYAEEFHSKRNYLGPRWWSSYALWEFREYNEMEHFFQRRMIASVKHADHYLRQFPAPVPTLVAGGISFIAGAFVGVLMVFTLMDDSILLYIKLDGRNLLWYVAIFSGILALARTFIPPLEETVFNPDKSMRRVVAFTHFLPNRWKGKAHTYDVRDDFSDYFQYKVILLIREMLCIMTTPYVMFFVLPDHATSIIEFVKARSTFVDGIGDVVKYSTLDLAKNGDPRYGSRRTSAVQSHLGDRFVNVKLDTACHGKLEKSWLGFKMNYPTWQTSGDERLDENLKLFQQNMVQQSLSNSEISSSSKALSASFLATVDLDRQRNMRQSTTSTNTSNNSQADHEFFGSNEAMVLPLGTLRYPNSENYFYWLEEYHDTNQDKSFINNSNSNQRQG